MFKKKTPEAKKVDTLIGKETSITGKLEARGILRIDGRYEGDIYAESDIIIGETALIKADVKGINITLAGRVEGNIKAENKLEIRSGGALIGDVTAAVLSIEEGSLFAGSCKMELKDQK
ncbi:MAG: polymer-forming cytoskeletal protein [Dethiobacter sp.]|nr:MAG: polymer-forming cytoskeletal protein [Dethiobacter sp.]